MKAYIDESGDEGTGGKGSRWLVFGCAMVSDANANAVKQVALNACVAAGRGKRRWLHFQDLNHDDRLGAISILTAAPWHGVVVASDTTSTNLMPGTLLRFPQYHYDYAARYIVERVSAMASIFAEPATIYFEKRRNIDLAKFRTYIGLLLRKGDARLNSKWIDPNRIYEMAKDLDETLCIPDGLSNAAFRALEPHRVWGRCERSYLEALIPSLWRGPTDSEDVHR